jgi:hypothetical protein
MAPRHAPDAASLEALSTAVLEHLTAFLGGRESA